MKSAIVMCTEDFQSYCPQPSIKVTLMRMFVVLATHETLQHDISADALHFQHCVSTTVVRIWHKFASTLENSARSIQLMVSTNN